MRFEGGQEVNRNDFTVKIEGQMPMLGKMSFCPQGTYFKPQIFTTWLLIELK